METLGLDFVASVRRASTRGGAAVSRNVQRGAPYGRSQEVDAMIARAREAVAAFGRGECFVERYLDKPRHVEAQVLADTHGGVVVVGGSGGT